MDRRYVRTEFSFWLVLSLLGVLCASALAGLVPDQVFMVAAAATVVGALGLDVWRTR